MKWLLAIPLAAVALAGDVSFTIAGLSVLPERGDKQANLAKLERYAHQAAAQGAQVVITPECFLDGYTGNDTILDQGIDREQYLAMGETLDGPLLGRVRDLARELKIYLLVGYPERRGREMFNALVIYGPDGSVITRYSKTHILDERYNTQGSDFPVVATPFGKWGSLICYDRQFPETARILALKGAQIILVPSYGAHGEMNDVMMRTRAYENSVWVAFVHPKRCLFIDPRGNVIAKDSGEGDQIVTAQIKLDHRVGRGPIQNRRPELYGDLVRK
ncbi:MAG: carbon-nitrogen hydrolase family protein [Acidobacteria bacterium]|nr:carbon-nitrogen hydrolase family protein [Acidobacteriota bacterium]